VQQELRRFAHARGWEQFHTPRSLLLALVAEIGELAELYQWARDGHEAPPDRVAEEVADVVIYLLRFSDVVGVDIESAVASKLELNERRFPPNNSGEA